ncbi:serine/threonine-protein kinase [Paenibacillus piscarius]|uniref:serine/threonine-protein kinase n=1 Tax=Paenibacillus piscarius TaxID=1089681 RepID=UPI001EE8BD30|nr:serine/threonine-protein kinase [Paenibacillus piscarius]
MEYAAKLQAGQILGERYAIRGLLGTGGMSQVYLAEDLRLPGVLRAVKESVIREGQAGAGAIRAEAELLSSLRHPLLPQIADFFPPDPEGYSYLVMEYIEGITLQQYISEQPFQVPGGRIISYALQLLDVLEYLHSHQPPIIYRDLKPSNIMLTGEHELKVIDFGIARRVRSGSGGDTEKLGTAGFAAPEQYGGGQSCPQSDLYGLGALLLYMASGGQYSAWQPGMERRLRGGHLPDRLIPVIRRLLRQHPEERYASAEEVKGALGQLAPLKFPESDRAGVKTTLHSSRQQSGGAVQSGPQQSAVIIAVLGVSPGLGVTHTSLAAASCVSRAGLTAWVDCTPGSQIFNRMKGMAEAVEERGRLGAPDLPFTWKEVDFWPPAPAEGLPQRPDQDYAFIVLDLGTGGFEGALPLFTGSDVPLLIASGADWRLEETLHWLRRRQLVPGMQWRIGLPLAGEQAAGLLAPALGIAGVYSLPLQPDPFQRKGRLTQTLRSLLGLHSGLRATLKRW